MTADGRPSPEIIRQLERIEIEAWYDFYRAAPEETVSVCGIRAHRDGFACTTVAANIDILAFNRAIGIGIDTPLTNGRLQEITERFFDAGVNRFFVQVNPILVSSGTLEGLIRGGLRHYNNWVKLYRRLEKRPEDIHGADIREIGSPEADAFADILVASFEWTPQLKPMVAAVIGRPGWRFYMAYDGDFPVASAGMFIDGEYAWLDFASTLPGFRGKGAQTALISRRLQDGYDAGCRYFTVETAEQKPGRDSPSFRNIGRAGFALAYLRPNYIRTR